MSKSNDFENALLALIFHGTTIANLANNASASPNTQLFLSLHSADPGEAGSAATNEVTTGAYTGYTRVGVARNSGGFSLSGNTITLAANVDFPACTGGTGVTATHFAISMASTGTAVVLYKGAISPTIPISSGVTPRLTTGTTVTED